MAAHLKKLAAAAIQCAAIILAPSYSNWIGFIPWIIIVFGLLVIDIEKSNKVYPYESMSIKAIFRNRWVAFVLIYLLWQFSAYSNLLVDI